MNHVANQEFTFHELKSQFTDRIVCHLSLKEIGHIMGDVADQIATRYGILPRDITHAALQTIVLTTADGIDALDEARHWLQRVGIPDTHTIHQTPRQRWEQLLRNLFPASIILVDPRGSASPDLVTVPRGTDEDERAVRRLLHAAAGFLTAETTELEDAADLSQHWSGGGQATADGDLDIIDTVLRRATRAGLTLLDHAESGQWRNLLASYAPPTVAPASATVPAPAVARPWQRKRPVTSGSSKDSVATVSRPLPRWVHRFVSAGWTTRQRGAWIVVDQPSLMVLSDPAWTVHVSFIEDITDNVVDVVLDVVSDYCVGRRLGFEFLANASAFFRGESQHARGGDHGDSFVRIFIELADARDQIAREIREQLVEVLPQSVVADLRMGDGPLYAVSKTGVMAEPVQSPEDRPGVARTDPSAQCALQPPSSVERRAPKAPVAITGLGMITTAWSTVDDDFFWSTLMAGRSMEVPLQTDVDMSNHVFRFNYEANTDGLPSYHYLVTPKESRPMDPFALFGLPVVLSAYRDAGSPPPNPRRTAIVVGNAIGGRQTTHAEVGNYFLHGPHQVNPVRSVVSMPSAAAALLAMPLGWHGPAFTIVTTCASGADAIGHAMPMLREELRGSTRSLLWDDFLWNPIPRSSESCIQITVPSGWSLPRIGGDSILDAPVRRDGPGISDGERLRRLSDVMDHAGQDLDVTLTRIVQTAVELSAARYGALRVVSPDGQTLLNEFACVSDDGSGRRGHAEYLRPDRELTDQETRSVLNVTIRVQGQVFGSLFVSGKCGGTGNFTEDDEAMLEALAAAASGAASNARLREESLLRERFMAASSEVNSHLLDGGSKQDALALIARRTRELSNADCALLLLADGESTSEVVIRAAAGNGCADLMGKALPPDTPLAAWLAAMQDSELIPDVSALVPDEWPVAGVKYGSTIAMPLRAGKTVTGVLLVMRRRGDSPFPRGYANLSASFADQAALALELAERQRDQRQLDVLADRDRIAGDLHDHVIQRLYATGMSLQGVLHRVAEPTVRMRVNRAVEQLDETVREIRTSIFDLHTTGTPAALASLRRRLLDVVDDLTADTTVSPSVRIAGTVDTLVPEELAAHATAVLHEAVSNAVHHANAKSIVVTVEAGSDLIIDVVDDGDGMPAGAARSGLLGVERRAVKCGGQAVIVPGLDGGTRLTWRAPLTNTTQTDNVIRLFDREDAARGGREHSQCAAYAGSQSGHQVIQWTAAGQ